ncbi:MAG: hypothetical protein K0Q73_8558 [Paenibacillus sp.]|nr:hypothetical protein [Paenibacillus sp.]
MVKKRKRIRYNIVNGQIDKGEEDNHVDSRREYYTARYEPQIEVSHSKVGDIQIQDLVYYVVAGFIVFYCI